MRHEQPRQRRRKEEEEEGEGTEEGKREGGSAPPPPQPQPQKLLRPHRPDETGSQQAERAQLWLRELALVLVLAVLPVRPRQLPLKRQDVTTKK